MKRKDVEHVIGAAANILDSDRFVVIGSQAIHGTVVDPPQELLISIEVDIYPADAPERAIEIDGALGDSTQFHETFGYYAHGVGPETIIAPAGWEDRLVAVPIRERVGSARRPVGLFLERHDLILSKAVAGREHDIAFISVAVRACLVDVTELVRRVPQLPIGADHQKLVNETIRALHAQWLASRGSSAATDPRPIQGDGPRAP